jgi:hypothetical protein
MDGVETGREPLYQVWAIDTKTGQLVPVPFFPRVMKRTAEEWVSLMKMAIATRDYKDFADPRALLHMGNLN